MRYIPEKLRSVLEKGTYTTTEGETSGEKEGVSTIAERNHWIPFNGISAPRVGASKGEEADLESGRFRRK